MDRNHREEAFNFYQKACEFRNQVHFYNADVDPHCKPHGMTMHTMVDVAFFYREVENMLDDLRKELVARREKISYFLADEVSSDALSKGSTNLTCVGNFATAKVDTKEVPNMPRRGTPEYLDLLKAMGVTEEVAEAGILDAHYVRLGEYLSTKAGAGLHPFKKVLTTETKLSVTFRKKK